HNKGAAFALGPQVSTKPVHVRQRLPLRYEQTHAPGARTHGPTILGRLDKEAGRNLTLGHNSP
ncbi:MAG: hypothetical protein WAO08_35150, partial [Hyphomicrobiaceae bacterium]